MGKYQKRQTLIFLILAMLTCPIALGGRKVSFNGHVMWGNGTNSSYCSFQVFNVGTSSQKVKVQGQMRVNLVTLPIALVNCNNDTGTCPVDGSGFYQLTAGASVTFRAIGNNTYMLPTNAAVECSGNILVSEDRGALIGSGTLVGAGTSAVGGGIAFGERNYEIPINNGRPF